MTDEHRRTAASYDRVATTYAEKISGELTDKPLERGLLDAFAAMCGDSGPVLDLGCGPGHVAAHLAGHGLAPVGLDLSVRTCRLAAATTALPFVAGDMTALPFSSGVAVGVVSLYAVIHLDVADRQAAYAEMARVLRPGGHALVGFHVDDVGVPSGGATSMTSWWGHDVDLVFRFLDPAVETDAMAAAGLPVVARLDREPVPDVEHPSRRSYLLARRPDALEPSRPVTLQA